MKTVLFVDDEPEVLAGLRIQMRRHRDRWQCLFCASGAEALTLMGTRDIDAVVSDIRMPVMDGAALLAEVKGRFPDCVRIILSGYSEEETAIRVVPVAHRVLSKPASPQEIENTLNQAFALKDQLTDPQLIATIASVENLPVIPRLYSELIELLNQPSVGARDIAELVERDAVVCGRILQWVNSSFFAPALPINSVQQAVVRLGATLIRSVVLTTEIFAAARSASGANAERLDVLQRHGAITANLAATLFEDDQKARETATIALLHNIGRLLLITSLAEEYDEVISEAQANNLPLHEAEMARWGCHYGDLGAYLLSLWGLPDSIVAAVAGHLNPVLPHDRQLNQVWAVHLAAAHAQQVCGSSPGFSSEVSRSVQELELPTSERCEWIQHLAFLKGDTVGQHSAD